MVNDTSTIITGNAIQDGLDDAVTDSHQDLGDNNLNTPTPSYVNHEVTITNGSDTDIRDYYEADDQELTFTENTTTGVLETTHDLAIGDGNTVGLTDYYEPDTTVTYQAGNGILINASNHIAVDSPTCDAAGDKLLWDGSQFICGSDTGSGSDNYLPSDPAPTSVDMNNSRISNLSFAEDKYDAVPRGHLRDMMFLLAGSNSPLSTVPISRDGSKWDGNIHHSGCNVNSLDMENGVIEYNLYVIDIIKHDGTEYGLESSPTELLEDTCQIFFGAGPASASELTSGGSEDAARPDFAPKGPTYSESGVEPTA
jgi:hypothetical protein